VAELTTDTLADLIDKRLACLVQLCKLGQKQSAYIESGEISSILRLLSAKNQLIVALQTIEKELEPFHAEDPEQRVWVSSTAREKCAQQAARCRELLDEVMQMERENELRMTRRRDQVARQLQNVQSATNTRTAYKSHQKQSHSRGNPIVVAKDSAPSVNNEHHLDITTDS